MKDNWNTRLLIVDSKTGKVNKKAMQAYNNLLISMQEEVHPADVEEIADDFVAEILDEEGVFDKEAI